MNLRIFVQGYYKYVKVGYGLIFDTHRKVFFHKVLLKYFTVLPNMTWAIWSFQSISPKVLSLGNLGVRNQGNCDEQLA